MSEFLKRHFVLLNFLFVLGLFLITLFGFIHVADILSSLNKTQKIFGVQTIPVQVREEARKDLQKNLHGAKLSKVNRDALNYQLSEIGLYVDNNSIVQLLSEQDLEELRKQRYEALLYNMKIMLHNEQVEYSRAERADGFGLLPSVQNAGLTNSSTVSAVEEEEEEEEISSVQNNKARVALRQKLLMRYILISLDEGLRKADKYKGKRVVGSEYIQEQLKKYSK